MNGVMSERDEINVRNQLASRRGRRTERRKGDDDVDVHDGEHDELGPFPFLFPFPFRFV